MDYHKFEIFHIFFTAETAMDRLYRTVKLPSKTLEAVERLVREHPECGYSSIADFVKDSIRHHYCWYVHRIKSVEESS